MDKKQQQKTSSLQIYGKGFHFIHKNFPIQHKPCDLYTSHHSSKTLQDLHACKNLYLKGTTMTVYFFTRLVTRLSR